MQSSLSFNTLTVDGDKVFGTVPNSTESFSFIDEVKVEGKMEFIVSLNEYGTQTVITKKIGLDEGNNKVYVIEVLDGKAENIYEVTIRRRPMYTVTFNTNGGTAVDSQTIEEDSCATVPNPTTRIGYTFDKWNYDFATPITENTTITASWKANTNTAYKVEYYLQNLENDEYTLKMTEDKSGTTDTTATAEIKEFPHFTHKPSATDSGNIATDGSTVLEVYYTRNRYTINVSAMDGKGKVSGAGVYANAQQVKITATINAGYTFDGWYKGDEKISSSSSYTFNPTENTSIVGKWTANKNTAYKVEYYLQNLENDEYTLEMTVDKSGTTDTSATAEIKEFPHFTVKNSNVTGNINGDGSTVLKVYYTRENIP